MMENCGKKILPKKIVPEYDRIHFWELYSSELPTEYRQSIEEGKDLSSYEDLFAAAAKMPMGEQKEKIAEALFDIVLNSGQVPDYPYDEPSDLENILLLRPEFEYKTRVKPGAELLKNKLHGAWLGRVCGCLLGKPIEGIRTNELHPFLKETNNFPMHRYIRASDITDEICGKYSFELRGKCYADAIPCAPVDDDTNYTVLANVLVEKYGRNFTPRDVAAVWLDYQKKDAYCTAERVAFCNFVKGFAPPDSAMYK
ncbi:MAG: ADP-ribosylglycohydrolase family protein, partial [Clostridiales bacterium]|nr:ADP-ribosylglycohydrolase family protein [Clostridiales bacterium]